jgi:hypothetical protein
MFGHPSDIRGNVCKSLVVQYFKAMTGFVKGLIYPFRGGLRARTLKITCFSHNFLYI